MRNTVLFGASLESEAPFDYKWENFQLRSNNAAMSITATENEPRKQFDCIMSRMIHYFDAKTAAST
jgi:hypothetical protein